MASVTFRGLDSRTSMVRWGLAAVAGGIVVGATAPTAAQSLGAALLTHPQNIPWYVERIVAFLAYLALAGSVIYGLLISTRLLDAIAHRPVTAALHRDLAAIGLGLAAIHGALLGLDHSMPFSLAQIAAPFDAPYSPLFVGLGQIALYLMIVIVASFYLRTRIGPRAWRRLHYVSFVAYAGATVHGIGAGTDSGAAWAGAIYAGSATATAFLLAYRVTIAIGSRIEISANARRQRHLADARVMFGGAREVLVGSRNVSRRQASAEHPAIPALPRPDRAEERSSVRASAGAGLRAAAERRAG